MEKSILILLTLLVCFSPTSAQKTMTLKGSVHGGVERSTLTGAEVLFTKSKKGTTCDAKGQFEISSKNPLPWDLTIRYQGYLDQRIVLENLDNFQRIKLKENPAANEKVIITPIPERKVIRGKILDKATKNPLIAVNVYDEKTEKGTVTELDGTFEFVIHLNCSKTLTISYVGFYDQKIKIDDPDQFMNIELVRNPNTTVCEITPQKPKRKCWLRRSKKKKSEVRSQKSEVRSYRS